MPDMWLRAYVCQSVFLLSNYGAFFDYCCYCRWWWWWSWWLCWWCAYLMIIAKQCIHIDFCDAVILFRYRQWRSRRCASTSRIGKIGQMWMWFRCACFLFTYFVSFNHQIKSSAHRTVCLLYGEARVLPFRSIPHSPGLGRRHKRASIE